MKNSARPCSPLLNVLKLRKVRNFVSVNIHSDTNASGIVARDNIVARDASLLRDSIIAEDYIVARDDVVARGNL